jgi:hypothetical protein
MNLKDVSFLAYVIKSGKTLMQFSFQKNANNTRLNSGKFIYESAGEIQDLRLFEAGLFLTETLV